MYILLLIYLIVYGYRNPLNSYPSPLVANKLITFRDRYAIHNPTSIYRPYIPNYFSGSGLTRRTNFTPSVSNYNLQHHNIGREVRINDPEVEKMMSPDELALKHILGVKEWNNLIMEMKRNMTPLKVDYGKSPRIIPHKELPTSPKSSIPHHNDHTHYHQQHRRNVSCDPVPKLSTYKRRKDDEEVLKFMDKEVVELKDSLAADEWNSIYDETERQMYKKEYNIDIENDLDDSVKEMMKEMNDEERKGLMKEMIKDIKYKEHMKDYGIKDDDNTRGIINYNNDYIKGCDDDDDEECEELIMPSNPVFSPGVLPERLSMGRGRSTSASVNRNQNIDGIGNGVNNNVIKPKYEVDNEKKYNVGNMKMSIDPNKSKVFHLINNNNIYII